MREIFQKTENAGPLRVHKKVLTVQKMTKCMEVGDRGANVFFT